MILRNIAAHYLNRTYAGHVINEGVAEGQLTGPVGPVGPQTYSVVIFPVPKFIIGINMLRFWQNSFWFHALWNEGYYGSKVEWKSLELPSAKENSE